jgi:hypothetical protein
MNDAIELLAMTRASDHEETLVHLLWGVCALAAIAQWLMACAQW